MSKHGRKHKWWPVTATTAVLLAMSGGAVALLDGPGQAAPTSGTAHLAPLTAARPSNGATVFGCVHSAGLRDIFDVSAVRHSCPVGSSGPARQGQLTPGKHRHKPSPSPSTTSPSPVSNSTRPAGTPSSATTTGTSVACPGSGWAFTTSDQQGGWAPPDGSQYYLYNNAWNAREAGPQTMCANRIGDWAVSSQQPDLASDPGSVKTYPEAQRNYPGVPITQFTSLTSDYAESMPTGLARLDAEAAYDVWLGNTSVATTEVMFWVDNAGQSEGGTLAQSNVSFGGRSWDLWCGGGTGANGCVNGTYYVWALHGMTPQSHFGQPSGSVDLLAGIKKLISDGFFRADVNHLMRQVNFGWEICSTGNQPAVFRVTNLTLAS